jgi:hypothetical protein
MQPRLETPPEQTSVAGQLSERTCSRTAAFTSINVTSAVLVNKIAKDKPTYPPPATVTLTFLLSESTAFLSMRKF